MIRRLLKGFQKFRTEEYESIKASMPSLVEDGQNPEYFIISCIDSRSNTWTIFNARPGTFFSFKAMGAIIRPHKQGTALSASLQFALKHCNVENIIILGHTHCGAIKALVEGIDDPEIASFLKVAQAGLKQAKKKTPPKANHENLLRTAEEEIVLQSAENLKTYPAVANKLKEGNITIKCWIFDMEHGALLEYDKQQDRFISITDS